MKFYAGALFGYCEIMHKKNHATKKFFGFLVKKTVQMTGKKLQLGH